MLKIKNVIAYFCEEYPLPDELSKARLTKMVYLADWFSALKYGKQITNIEWLFNHYGPYVDDVINAARSDARFQIISDRTIYGSHKEKVSFSGNKEDIELSDKEMKLLNFVISKTQKLYFNDFINYVYSTYPVSSEKRYSTLDLVSLAEEFKKDEEVS